MTGKFNFKYNTNLLSVLPIMLLVQLKFLYGSIYALMFTVLIPVEHFTNITKTISYQIYSIHTSNNEKQLQHYFYVFMEHNLAQSQAAFKASCIF